MKDLPRVLARINDFCPNVKRTWQKNYKERIVAKEGNRYQVTQISEQILARVPDEREFCNIYFISRGYLQTCKQNHPCRLAWHFYFALKTHNCIKLLKVIKIICHSSILINTILLIDLNATGCA